MREIQKIVQLFDDLQKGECWAGMNMQQALSGVDAATAAYKRKENGNSISVLKDNSILKNYILFSNTEIPGARSFKERKHPAAGSITQNTPNKTVPLCLGVKNKHTKAQRHGFKSLII